MNLVRLSFIFPISEYWNLIKLALDFLVKCFSQKSGGYKIKTYKNVVVSNLGVFIKWFSRYSVFAFKKECNTCSYIM